MSVKLIKSFKVTPFKKVNPFKVNLETTALLKDFFRYFSRISQPFILLTFWEDPFAEQVLTTAPGKVNDVLKVDTDTHN